MPRWKIQVTDGDCATSSVLHVVSSSASGVGSPYLPTSSIALGGGGDDPPAKWNWWGWKRVNNFFDIKTVRESLEGNIVNYWAIWCTLRGSCGLGWWGHLEGGDSMGVRWQVWCTSSSLVHNYFTINISHYTHTCCIQNNSTYLLCIENFFWLDVYCMVRNVWSF